MRIREAGIRIEYMDIEGIESARRNPKDHDIGEIDASIGRHGYVDPVLIDERTGRLVKGHGRRDALLGMKRGGGEAPRGIEVSGGKWLIPVVRGIEFETDEEAESYLVADNKVGEIGGWNEPILAQVLKEWGEREESGEDVFSGTGFDIDEAERIVREAFGEASKAEEAEEVEGIEEDAAAEKWGVEDGEIWMVGEDLVVVCGDCRDDSNWRNGLSYLGVGEASGIITSPPYARQREYGGRHGERGVAADEYVEWWADVQSRAMKYLAKDGSLFVNIKAHTEDGERSLYVMDLVLSMKRDHGWAYIDEFCWERVGNPGSWPNRFKNGFEPVFHFGLTPHVKFRPDNVVGDEDGVFEFHGPNANTGGYFNTNDTRFEWEGALPSNRIGIKESAKGIGHEAAFPWKLPAFFLRAFSDEADVWVDPFSGSGSTLEACHRMARRGLGIEIAPAYVAVTLERLALLTGIQPRKV